MLAREIILTAITICCSCSIGYEGAKNLPAPVNRNLENVNSNSLSEEKQIVFELERIFSECYGSCPVYKVVIYSTGDVAFKGIQNVKKIGEFRGKIPTDDLEKLKARFDDAGFTELLDRYVMEENCSSPILSDGPSARIVYITNSKRKEILHYSGCYGPGVFDKLKSLEEEIDRVANTKQWI